eukprot:3354464-Prymnesium_polylepis.1
MEVCRLSPRARRSGLRLPRRARPQAQLILLQSFVSSVVVRGTAIARRARPRHPRARRAEREPTPHEPTPPVPKCKSLGAPLHLTGATGERSPGQWY